MLYDANHLVTCYDFFVSSKQSYCDSSMKVAIRLKTSSTIAVPWSQSIQSSCLLVFERRGGA